MRRRDFIAAIGSAAAWPRAAQAQRRPLPVIGILSGSTASPFLDALRNGLGEQGYVEGRNVEILYRYAELQYDRLPKLAADLVDRRVAVLFAASTVTAVAAKSSTATIPIVFAIGTDPVDLGLVSSLNRPGGNLTGVYFLVQELTAKRLELLHEIVPAAQSIGFLTNTAEPITEAETRQAETAARVLGVRLVIANASTPGEIDASFASLVDQGIAALLVGGPVLFFAQRSQLVALASRYGVPAIYPFREAVDIGGLMNYGASVADAYRLAGTYVGRILKGDKPSDLPVQQLNTRIDMVLNLKTAKALGIDPVPTATLLRATEVIEVE
jgi:putative tryptophan/tyrosine transport system substrate-binding protein